MRTLNTLPYKVLTHDVLKILGELPNGMFQKSSFFYRNQSLSKVYVPFSSGTISGVQSRYKAKVGAYINENSINERTSYWDISGVTDPVDYPFGTITTQIYNNDGSLGSAEKHVNQALRMTEIVNCGIQPIFMEPFDLPPTVHSHCLSEDEVKQRLCEQLQQPEEMRVRAIMTFDRDVRTGYIQEHSVLWNTNNNNDNNHTTTQFKHIQYHIPAYIYTAMVGNRHIMIVVNGYNGAVSGNIVYSGIKTGCAGSVIGYCVGLMCIPSDVMLFELSHIVSSCDIVLNMCSVTAVLGGVCGSVFAHVMSTYQTAADESVVRKRK